MYDDERQKESEMDSNRFRMAKINRVFSIAFYVCAALPAVQLIIGILNVATTLITLGLKSADPFTMLKSIFLYAAMIGAFMWSYFKDIRGTAAAIAAIAVWWLIGWTSWRGDLFLNGITIIWLAMQIVCLTKYKELKFLRNQPGYPDFNSVFFHQTNNRILSDRQIREQLQKNKNAGMELMEFLDGDGSVLEEKHSRTSGENHFMDEIFTDDLHKDI